MLARKSEMRARLLLTLCAVCLLPSVVTSDDASSSSAHHDSCPSSRVAEVCKACSSHADDINHCCSDVLLYSDCRDGLDTQEHKSVAKRSLRRLDDSEMFDDIEAAEKRKNPFLGKRARNPFLGKRRVNPFLGKRRSPSPFLGKRTTDELAERLAEKRRSMPFLG